MCSARISLRCNFDMVSFESPPRAGRRLHHKALTRRASPCGLLLLLLFISADICAPTRLSSTRSLVCSP